MPLDPKQVQDAFSRAMPGMRFEFAQEWDAFRATIFRQNDYVRRYPEEVLRLTGNEVRRRHKDAADLVRRLLDSGWRPTVGGEVRTVFLGCFGTTDFREDPSSDLYEKARTAYSDIGQPDPPNHGNMVFRLGEIQAQTANEMMADLETHVVKEPQQTHSTTYHVNNNAPVAVQQLGDGNTASNVTQNIAFDSRKVADAIAVVRAHMEDFPEADRDDVKTYVAEIEEELATASPRPTRVKSALSAIGRVAGGGALEVVKTVTEGAVAAIMKRLGAPG